MTRLSLVVCLVGTAAFAQRAPPAEAYTACSSKAQGDACSVQLGDRQLSGNCAVDPAQKLFCAPPHPHHGPPPEALAACASKSAGDACSATFPDGSSRSGVCRAGPDQQIACAPADAPLPPER